MSFNPDRHVETLVCYSHECGDTYPHWLLSLRSVGAKECTRIHSIGGPSQERDYECSIRANKSLDSRSIASTSLQGTIVSQDVQKIIAIAKRIELQQCQMYVVAVVAELENEGSAAERSNCLFKRPGSDVREINRLSPRTPSGQAGYRIHREGLR